MQGSAGNAEIPTITPTISQRSSCLAQRWVLLAMHALGLYWVILSLLQLNGPDASWHVGNRVGWPWISLAWLAGFLILASGIRLGRKGQTVTWAMLRLAGLVLIGSWLFLLFREQSFRAPRVLLGLAFAVGLLAFLLLTAAWWRRILPPKVRRSADLVLTNLFLVVLGMEIALRMTAQLYPHPIFARSNQAVLAKIADQRFSEGELRFGFPCNSAGYYDSELQGEKGEAIRVISIGDSFSAGIVPHVLHFSTVAEDQCAGVEIYNMGLPDIGPPEYLNILETEALALQPDAILINLFLGNDAQDSHRWLVDRSLLASWFDRENVLLCVLWRRLGKLQHQAAAQPTASSATDMPWLGDVMQEQGTFTPEGYLEVEIARASYSCGAGATENYGPMLRILTAIKEAHGSTPLLCMLIPDEFQVNDGLWEDIRGRAGGLALQRSRPQEIVGLHLAQLGIPCLDLLPKLRAVKPCDDGQRHVYHLRDSHFNVRGNACAGRALAEFLGQQGLAGR